MSHKIYKTVAMNDNGHVENLIETTVETHEVFSDGFLFIYEDNESAGDRNPFGIINLNNCICVTINER